MSRLALGTVQFGLQYGVANQLGQVSLLEAKSMLQLASENGISTLDTAIAYGESEQRLGEVGVETFKVVTKLPAIPAKCLDVAEWVRQQVEGSLCRLRMSNVYGLLLHHSRDLLGLNSQELYKALYLLKERGLVEKIGVSIYSPEELELLTTVFRFDLVQAPFSQIDKRLLSSGWLQKLKDSGVEIHTRSAFLQGLLLMNRTDIPKKFLPWSDLLNRWHSWLDDNNVSALQASLAFPLSFPEIDRVVVGADSRTHLLEIVNASKNELITQLPNLACLDENLINPANWPQL